MCLQEFGFHSYNGRRRRCGVGAQQRKHPATETGQSHISLTSGTQSTRWSHFCHQPTETVWWLFFYLWTDCLNSYPCRFCSMNKGFDTFISPGPLSLSCGCMMETIHLMFGIGKRNVWTWFEYGNIMFYRTKTVFPSWAFLHVSNNLLMFKSNIKWPFAELLILHRLNVSPPAPLDLTWWFLQVYQVDRANFPSGR